MIGKGAQRALDGVYSFLRGQVEQELKEMVEVQLLRWLGVSWMKQTLRPNEE